MSAIGIDLGSRNTLVAAARNRGVDVLCNEVSNRFTPTLISFGSNNRYIGEAAKSQEISNFSNTVYSIKNLLGLPVAHPHVDAERPFLSKDVCKAADDDSLVYPVSFLSENRQFTPMQAVSMFLKRVTSIVSSELSASGFDQVISVPCFFSDQQRRALMNAVDVAGLGPTRLINDTAAASLAWGMPRADLPAPELKPLVVCFVDIGYSSTQVCITEFSSLKAVIKGVSFDKCLGGRNFDLELANHFAAQFSKSHNVDICSNKKAFHRLREACEKTKKILTSNAVAPFSVESLYNDIDFNTTVARNTFDEITAPLVTKLDVLFDEALKMSKYTKEDIFSVEIVGGSTRIPSIKNRISAYFEKDVSTTMNQDEAVVKGAALMAAIISPQFKVKEYNVSDVSCFPIECTWTSAKDSLKKSCIVFDSCNQIPSTKFLNLDSLPKRINVKYSNASSVDESLRTIGTVEIHPAKSYGENREFKMKIRLNPSGIISVESIHLVNTNEEEQQGTEKVPFNWTPYQEIGDEDMNCLVEAENAMCQHDKLVSETSDARNALEEFIYHARSRIEEGADTFIDKVANEKFKAAIGECELWLYDGEGSSASKLDYNTKLEGIKKQFAALPVSEPEQVESEDSHIDSQCPLENEAQASLDI